MPEAINIIILLIGGFGGAAGVAALWNARTSAKRSEVDALRDIIDALTTENKRLSDKVTSLEAIVKASGLEVGSLRDIIITLREENERLAKKVTALETTVTALQAENVRLRAENTELRARVGELENGRRNDG